MKFGLSDQDYEILSTIVLKTIFEVKARVYVFGSRASGKNHPFSDIDLLIDDSTSTQEIHPILSRVVEEIEESKFPVKVELVLMRHLAKSYQDSIFSERIEIASPLS